MTFQKSEWNRVCAFRLFVDNIYVFAQIIDSESRMKNQELRF